VFIVKSHFYCTDQSKDVVLSFGALLLECSPHTVCCEPVDKCFIWHNFMVRIPSSVCMLHACILIGGMKCTFGRSNIHDHLYTSLLVLALCLSLHARTYLYMFTGMHALINLAILFTNFLFMHMKFWDYCMDIQYIQGLIKSIVHEQQI